MGSFFELGDPEVRELYIEVFGDKDVCGLDIAVNDAHPVGVLESTAALEHHLDDSLKRQEVVHDRVLREGSAGDVVHHHVAVFVLHRRIEQGNDVRMLQLADQSGFGEECAAVVAAERGIFQRVVEDLDCDITLRECIAGAIHRTRGATAQFAKEVVLADRRR